VKFLGKSVQAKPAGADVDMSDGVPTEILGYGNCQHNYPQCLTYTDALAGIQFGKINALYELQEKCSTSKRKKWLARDYHGGVEVECPHCKKAMAEQKRKGLRPNMWGMSRDKITREYHEEVTEERLVRWATASDSAPIKYPGCWGPLKLRPKITGIPWISNRPSLIPTPVPIHEEETVKNSAPGDTASFPDL